MIFTVPGYRVDRLLGAGAQAEVWLGEDIATGERVALKRIPAATPAVAADARAEAALLAALDHPSLIALRAFVPTEAAMVLVLELAEGGSLAGLLTRRHRLTPQEVVATISPVAAALAHAHDAGVLHGDVSAANILFTPAGRPKLTDLGLARILALAADQPLGTPTYLDPTIAAGGPAGLASDVFSLAAVALHALTGAGPWSDPRQPNPSADQVLATAATGEIVDRAGRLAAMPPAIAEVLMRALHTEPYRRGTAAELALDLRAALPPTPVRLVGGRIVQRPDPVPVGRVPGRIASVVGPDGPGGTGLPPPAGESGQPASTALRFVPADLTVVARPRPPADIATMLRDLAGSSDRHQAPAAGCRHWWHHADRLQCRRVAAWLHRGHAAAGWLHRRRAASRHWSANSPDDPASGRQAGRHRAVQPMPVRPWYGQRPVTVGLLLAGALVTALLLGWPQSHRRAAATQPASSAAQPASSAAQPAGSAAQPAGSDARTATRTATSDAADRTRAGTADRSATGTADPSATDLAAILTGLDAVREQAFAMRQPGLLAGIYASPTLLAADTAQLLRSVPIGCRLIGVRTSYRDVHPLLPTVLDSAGRMTSNATGTRAESRNAARTESLNATASPTMTASLTVTAALPAANLSCAGTALSQTRPVGPMRLRLVLSDDGHGWRIASQRLE